MENKHLINIAEDDLKVIKCFGSIAGMGRSKTTGITLYDIQDKAEIKMTHSKIHRSLIKLLKANLIDYGLKKGKRLSYYITMDGIKYIQDIQIETQL